MKKTMIQALLVLFFAWSSTTMAQITVTHDISCSGRADGSMEVNAIFGTAPYTYVWNTGVMVDSIINLSAGTYSVTVTDDAFTTMVFTSTLIDPTPLLTTCTSTSVSCFGGNDGTATVNAIGGSGMLNYLWNNGGTTSTITNLNAGNYAVTVTDANLCSTTNFVNVTQPPGPVQATLVQTNVSCFGGNNGTATVTNTSGGSGILTYLWSNGNTTSQITNVTTGTYDVTITDANACTFVGSVNITQAATALTVTLNSQTNVLCRGTNTGAINVNVAGGTIPYTYNWSNGALSQDISNVPAGAYTLIVTDTNGCTASIARTITQPATVVQITSLVASNVSCYGGSNGTLTANAAGGTGILTYLWSTGANTPNITNLTAGNYAVTVSDANGCTTTANATITQPPTPVQAFPLWHNVTCNGGNDGNIYVIAVGGTGNLTYLWSTGSSNDSVTNLTAGNYAVTVTDANSCTAAANVTITQPVTPVSVSFMTTLATCNAWNDATATATGSGGTNPLHYLWSTGENTPTITNLNAGTYFVTVTDGVGCSTTNNVVVNQPAQIAITPTIISSNCDGQNNGAINLVVSGGTAPYDFSWHELNFDSTYVTQNLLGVRGGNYALNITDANGCIYLDTLVVPNLATVAININPTSYVCNGAQGVVSINALLADTLYYFTYSWNTPYNTGSFITNDSVFTSSPSFIAGTYTITVTDNQTGCASYYDFTIDQSATPLVVAPIVQHNTCYADMQGSVTLQVSGGNPMPGYHVTWNGPNVSSSTTLTINNLAVGEYNYTVTDDGVCSVSGEIRIEPLTEIQGHISVDNIMCNGGDNGQIEAFYSGGTGPLSYSWSNGASTYVINNLGIGTYTLTVTDSVGCNIITSATITQPPAITITLDSLHNIQCYGGTNGGIWLTTSGGSGTLEYIWLHNGTLFPQVNEDIVDVPAGIYQVTVFDSIGCFATNTFTLTQPAQTLFADSIHVISCNNGADGYWQIMPIGIDTPYIAIFSTGDTISTDTVPAPCISGLSAGSYSCGITSILGCTWTFDLVLEQPLPITVGLADIVPVICKYDTTGSITLDNVHGGTPGYTYLWSNGLDENPITNIAAGIYNLTITDALGCHIYETYEVHEPFDTIKFVATVKTTSCQQAEDGEIRVDASQIDWSPYSNSFLLYDSLNVLIDSVAPGETIGNLPPGPYMGIIINQYGCTASDSLYVEKGPEDCITIPNLVTVNADGFNDVFAVQGGCEYDEFSVEIFTDQGVQVFESSDCLFTWNPDDNKAAANTVYYYYIKVAENGKPYIFRSSINITK